MYENDGNNNYDYNQPKVENGYGQPETQQTMYSYPASPQPVYAQPTYTIPPAPKKESGFGRKIAAMVMVVVLAFTCMGIGIGIGSSVATGGNETQSFIISEAPGGRNIQIPRITFDSAEGGQFFDTERSFTGRSNVALTAGDSDVVSVIKAVSNSVVSINVSTTYRDIFNRTMAMPSAGSGIICAEDAANIYIVTNYHVIEAAESVEISIDDDKSFKASPVGSDAENDIAVIMVAKADLIGAGIDDYEIAIFGDAQAMEVGETVIAIGNALGEGKSATVGIISAKNKQITAESNNYVGAIQTDAAINKGNSGGALVNLKGQVIGVNTVKLIAIGAEGMGYAIPSNTVKEIVDTLMEQGSVERPFLGISGREITDNIKERYSLPSLGIYVMEISEGSGAGVGGLKVGDIITSFNGVPVLAMEKLQEEVAKTKVGDMVEVKLFRDTEEEIILTIEMRDANAYKSF